MARLSDELIARLERLAASEGVELVAVEVAGTARVPVVRLILDRIEGGVTLVDCERVSRQASLLLDEQDPFPGRFTLEVSSPGLDRKLFRPQDFVRFAGCQVQVRMKPTWTAARRIQGELVERKDGCVVLRNDEGTTVRLPETEIFETRLTPQLGEPASPQRRGRQR